MINLRIYDPRILAIDLRRRRFGFSVFEGPRRLIGWGVRFYPANDESEAALMGKRLAALLAVYSPSAIVVTKEQWDRALSDTEIRTLVEEILRLAEANDITVRGVGHTMVRQSFVSMQSGTKHEIANSLARIFPELSSRLPPARRTWESEHSIMTMFDATALGLSFWLQDSEFIFIPDHLADVR